MQALVDDAGFRPCVSRSLVFASFAAFSMLAPPTLAQEGGDITQMRKLGQCQRCSFQNLDMADRNLTALDLTQAQLRDVDFSNAELDIAIFDYAVLENVSFASADLGGASFRGARLINVDFSGAEMGAAVLEDASVEGTDLQAGTLCNTQMPNETMDNSDCD